MKKTHQEISKSNHCGVNSVIIVVIARGYRVHTANISECTSASFLMYHCMSIPVFVMITAPLRLGIYNIASHFENLQLKDFKTSNANIELRTWWLLVTTGDRVVISVVNCIVSCSHTWVFFKLWRYTTTRRAQKILPSEETLSDELCTTKVLHLYTTSEFHHKLAS